MSNSFRDRLRRLHDAHHRGRDPSDGPSGVYSADDVDAVEQQPDDDERHKDYGGWQGLGARRCGEYECPLWIVETRCDEQMCHGDWTLARCRGADHQKLASLTDDVPSGIDPDRLLYMDTETTGLGPKSYAFMVGLGRWDGADFLVQHLVIDEPDDEPALLECFADRIADCDLLVTFNGKRFDVPLLQRRYEHHGLDDPFADTGHLDLLPLARRIFPGLDRYRLSNLEVQLLKFQRVDDVPGREVPKRWGKFQRSRNPAIMEGVVEHNRHDIVSMAALVAAAIGGEKIATGEAEPDPNSDSRQRSGNGGGGQTPGNIADKLVRSYRLRGKFAERDRQRADSTRSTPPVGTEQTVETPDSETTRRVRELRSGCRSLIDQKMWREVFPMLCELVALCPGDRWGLEMLAEYYRREGRNALAREIEGRRRDG